MILVVQTKNKTMYANFNRNSKRKDSFIINCSPLLSSFVVRIQDNN